MTIAYDKSCSVNHPIQSRDSVILRNKTCSRLQPSPQFLLFLGPSCFIGIFIYLDLCLDTGNTFINLSLETVSIYALSGTTTICKVNRVEFHFGNFY